MSKRFLYFVIILALRVFSSCSFYVEEEKPKGLSIYPSDTLTIESSITPFTVNCGELWDISSLPDWAHIASIEQSEHSLYEWDVLLSCSSNQFGYDRSGEMEINTNSQSKTLTLYQFGGKGKYTPLTGIQLDKSVLEMTVGDHMNLFATFIPENASEKSLWWMSNNTDVATVTYQGLVQGISPGAATITVTTADKNISATCEVSVLAIGVDSINLNTTDLWLKPGETFTLEATVFPQDATNNNVTYSSSDRTVASVDSYGKVTAVSQGIAYITVVSSDNPLKKATCSVRVSYSPQITARIAPKTEYVTVDNAESKDYSVEVKGHVDNRYHYYLDDMFFRDYIKVVDYSEVSEPLLIDLKTITSMSSAYSVVAPTSPIGLKRLNEDKTVANLATDMKYKWGTFNGLEFLVATRLISAAQQGPQVLVDSATVRVWTKNPIPVFDGGDMLVVEHGNGRLLSANIVANLNIKDLNGISLNNSSGLRQIGYDEETKEVVVNYDQALWYGNIYDFNIISGVQYLEYSDLSWDVNKRGTLNLRLKQDIIDSPIIIEVPVNLTHMFDQRLDWRHTAWVTVMFVEQ